jgi:hypothetical protein
MRLERATIRAKIWQKVAHAHHTKPPDPKQLWVFAETCILGDYDETFRRCRIANAYLKRNGSIPVDVVVTPFVVRRIQVIGEQLFMRDQTVIQRLISPDRTLSL